MEITVCDDRQDGLAEAYNRSATSLPHDQVPIRVDRNLLRVFRDRGADHLSAGPSHPNPRGGFRARQNRHRAILRPVATTAVNLPARAGSLPKEKPHLCTEAVRIAGWADQANSQPRLP